MKSLEARGNLRNIILSKFNINKFYPKRARLKGWQGKVEILIKMDSEGLLDSVLVDKSSGRRILDQAAKEMVLNVFANLDNLDTYGLRQITIPIEFRLERR